MRSRVLQHLWREKGGLVEALWQGMRCSEATHYRHEDPERLRERCARWVEEFLDAFERNPRAFGEYVRAIAEDRLGEGYRLDELQLVLDVFRQCVWKLTVESLEDRQLMVEYLDLATTILDRARDAAARTYLDVARRGAARVHDTDQLFRGTEAMNVLDE